MTITYKKTKQIDFDKLMNLYQSVQWTGYTQHPDKMKAIIKNSLYVLSAWDNDKLVGLIRVVGDNASIIYIQDILVDPMYQRNKIGTELLTSVLKKYRNIRQIVLITDNNEKTKTFYESIGMQHVSNTRGIAFIKYNFDV